MDKHTVFQLNKLADEYEEKAKAYRAVANDLMNGTGHEAKPKKNKKKKVTVVEEKKPGSMKGHKYNGKHWMQKPENKAKMMKRIKVMHQARKAGR